MIRYLIPLILSSCALSNPALELAEEPGEYASPIDKTKWAYCAYGFYINRATEFDDTITYEALYDNRKNKKGLMSIYQATDDFRRYYPAFIRHKGKTDCGSNSATIEQLDDNFKPVRTEQLTSVTEVSTALCSIKRLSTEK